jgi:hypothetical protein
VSLCLKVEGYHLFDNLLCHSLCCGVRVLSSKEGGKHSRGLPEMQLGEGEPCRLVYIRETGGPALLVTFDVETDALYDQLVRVLAGSL